MDWNQSLVTLFVIWTKRPLMEKEKDQSLNRSLSALRRKGKKRWKHSKPHCST